MPPGPVEKQMWTFWRTSADWKQVRIDRVLMLTTYHKIGLNRGSPRIWLESPRLHQLGFEPKTFLQVSPRPGNGLSLRPSAERTKHRVSARQISRLFCPIIDLNSQAILAEFMGHTELRLQATYKQLLVEPSCRSFAILEHRKRALPIPAMEYFAGGSTLTQAITADPRFNLVGAVEISGKYAAHFTLEHPSIPLYQCDIRDLNPAELPSAGFLFASLPCTCFSPLGVAKKGLKDGKELGDSGDLFMSFAHHVASKMPLALVVENVPTFFGKNAIAGRTLMAHLERIGYHVHYVELSPHEEWGEIQDRRRGVMIATLYGKFYPSVPMTPFTGTAAEYLDPPDPVKDRQAAESIQAAIEGRARHRERHQAQGHRFGFSVINYTSTLVPTICRTYARVNTGPFVETPYGPRLLRQGEIERLMGFHPSKGYTSPSYRTAVEILGQGVQTRIFTALIHQLGDYLQFMIENNRMPAMPPATQKNAS